nr:hypothetical protein [Epichloe sp. LpTG-3]UUW39102.1 hypothetical protein [Epichloe sp. LpTG-3]
MLDLGIIESTPQSQPPRQPPLVGFAVPLPPPQIPSGPFKLVHTPTSQAMRTEPICFRFRTRRIHAIATQADREHPNVLLLQVNPSAIEKLIQIATSLLPSALRMWLRASFPEWSLPSCLVLKKCKVGWDEEFEAEKATYKHLEQLQGILIPEYYGEVRHGGTRACLLSDIGGACMATPAGAMLAMTEFRDMITATLTTLAEFGVLPDDTKLDNFHLVGDKVMAVDLETVSKVTSKEDVAAEVASVRDCLARQYAANQRCFWDDGQLQQA